MTKHHFSFKEAFVFGYTKTKQHYWFCILSIIAFAILCTALDRVQPLKTIVLLMVGLSLAHVSLLMVRDHSFSFASFIDPLLSPKKVLKFFAVTAIYAIPVIVTMAILYVMPRQIAGTFGLLISLPMIYLMVRLKFFPYVVLENEDLKVIDIIKKSFSLTKNHVMIIFSFLVLLGLFNILGALALGVGLLFTIPVSIFSTAYIYTKLKDHSL